MNGTAIDFYLCIHRGLPRIRLPGSFSRRVQIFNPFHRTPLSAGVRGLVKKHTLYCREEIASALNDFGSRWCKRESVECNAWKEWKLSIFNIVDKGLKFYSHNTDLLPPKPKSSFRHLKQDIKENHRKYVLVPADKAVTLY